MRLIVLVVCMTPVKPNVCDVVVPSLGVRCVRLMIVRKVPHNTRFIPNMEVFFVLHPDTGQMIV